MPKLLTYDQIEQVGADRILELALELKPMCAGTKVPLGIEATPSATATLCAKVVGEAWDTLGVGASPSLVMAELFTSGLLLGYAMAFEEVDEDRALIERVTGGE